MELKLKRQTQNFCSPQLLSQPSRVRLFATPWTAAPPRPPCPSPTPGVYSHSCPLSRCLFTLMFIESVMPSNRLMLCLPLLLPPSVFASIRVFSDESVLRLRWPQCWSFSFSISPSNEYSGLISSKLLVFIKMLPSMGGGLLWWLRSKESACNAGDTGSIPGSGRSPGRGGGNPLQYSCLENSMDRGAWWATVHGGPKSQTGLSN